MSGIMFRTLVLVSFFSFFISHVWSLGATDTITWGGDNSRAGYQTNHNMDPSVVGSSQFGQLFRTALPGNYGGALEQIFSQPLVYTAADGVQYVYVATTQNNIYKINAKTGVIAMSRSLHIPFLAKDLNGCFDINPHIGVIGTGTIDPSSDTLYLIAKTYEDQTQINIAQGKPAGRSYLHAINVNDLTERANFPVGFEGVVARNSHTRSYNGGIHNQRPALLQTGQFIYAGFGTHCVQYNATGWIMGWDKSTGAMVERWATEGEGPSNTSPGGGVWMSGGGISSDDAGSIFFGTGNGFASQLSTISVNGRNPPTAIEEAAVHMTINSDGSLTLVDFFMPYEKQSLDGADKDLGTTALEILPSSTFSCGDYKRIGVITGKTGKTYFLNLDDLGGYQNGPNKQDKIIGVYQSENSVYSSAGVYPGEGGYVYINVIQYPSHVFKFSCSNGVPAFTKVADSPGKNAYILGTGHGTTTSLNGQAGTGLYWVTDVEGQNLRVYNAVPVNGLLTQIAGFNIVGVTKFSRPAFGDARAYVGTTQGYLYAFGSPVNLPLNCTSPVNFGTSSLNTPTNSTTITCLASVGVTVSSFNLTGNGNFNVTGVPAAPLKVAAGKTFTFQAYFNPQTVGPLSSDFVIATTNSVAGYSVNTPVTFRGTGQSTNALLQVSPVVLSFQGAVTGMSVDGVNQSFIINNLGNSPLTISTIKYSLTSETGPFVPANDTSSGPRAGAFTFIGLPSIIQGNSGVTVIVNFDTSSSGNFAAYLNIVSNGGTKVFDVIGTSGSAPKALVEFQTSDGSGWVQYQAGQNFTFGNVTENNTKYLKMRLSNTGDATSSNLHVTVSKPPVGVAGIINAVNAVDLAEGTDIAPGQNVTASLYCSVPKEQWNTDPYSGSAVWTLNLDDPTFGKQVIQFSCGAVSEQAPPLQSNGLGLYKYTGCFKENNPGRQLKQQLYSSNNNTEANCIAACSAAKYIFCATQYQQECWGGNTIPIQQVDEGNCNFACTGDSNQICGGNGYNGNTGSFMSLFADRSRFDGNVTSTSPVAATGPFVNPGVNGYNSIGCYTEGSGGRALSVGMQITTKTVASCVNACGTGSYIYAGLEYGGECWCGNAFGTGAIQAPLTDCSMPCNDNGTEYCGAGNRLNVYQKYGTYIASSSSKSSAAASSTGTGTSTGVIAPTSTSGPQIKKVVSSNWSFGGCYTEATNGRALANTTYAADTMTLESCAAFCQGNSMFGVEYARECYCANKLSTGSALAANQADCSMVCKGDETEYCGAGNRLQLYNYAPAAASSSTSSSLSSSAQSSILSSGSSVASSTATLSGSASSSSSSVSSVSSSISSVVSSTLSDSTSISSSSSSVSPVSSSTSTDSGSVSSTNSVPSASSSTSSSSNYVSSVSSSTLSVSSSTSSGVSSSVQSPTTISSSSTQITTSSSVSATPTGPQIVKTAGAYQYEGCYTEATNARALSSNSYALDTMTVESCATFCGAYSMFGVEYGRECYCGNSFNNGSMLTKDTDCSMICKGNTLEYCGNGNRLNVYVKGSTSSSSSSASVSSDSNIAPSTSQGSSSSSTVSQTSSSATPTQTGLAIKPTVGTFTYQGCYTEATNQRALSSATFVNYTSMTLEMCAASCSSSSVSTTMFGVEYGGECYCGNSRNTGSVLAKDADCSFPCPGNKLEYCGAGNRLSLYILSSGIMAQGQVSSSSSSSIASSSSSTSQISVSSSTSSVPATSSTDPATSSSITQMSSSSSSVSSTSVDSLSSSSTMTQASVTQSSSSSTFSLSSVIPTSSSSSSSSFSSSTSSSSSAKATPTGPVISQGNVNFTYYGCVAEPSNGRLLASQVENNGTYMTIEKCLADCPTSKYVGVQFGQECWCGSSMATGGNNASDSDCNFECPGNSTEYCGAGNRLSLYYFDVQKALMNSGTANGGSTAMIS